MDDDEAQRAFLIRLLEEVQLPPAFANDAQHEQLQMAEHAARSAAAIGTPALEFEVELAQRRNAVARLLIGPILREGEMSLPDVLEALGPEERGALFELLDGRTIGEVLGLEE